ncbi:cysteine hydrolase [Antarctobacter sp.]|uniref:cysteine hydrolase family protein n=1 Tax=Antarctobacter sp. TaxID=1872577 RepID=UPI002B26A8CB|nr:cysteine hydrolase [Antarctobacter sp.]
MTVGAPLWTAAQQLGQGRAALLVVDLQNDFTHPDGFLARRRGVEVEPVRRSFPAVEKLIYGARRAGVPVIWLSVVHEVGVEPGNYLAAQLREPPTSGEISASDLLTHRGSWGARWDSALPRRLDGEVCLEKPGYNGFYCTDLPDTLERLGVQTLVLCGCNTNVCIQATAAEAFFRGHYVVLAADACTSLDGIAAHDAALATHRKYYGQVLTADEILTHW